MITWEQACIQANYSIGEKCPYEKVYNWFAYKGGVVKCFDNSEDALLYSLKFEKVLDEEASLDFTDWWATRRESEQEAKDIWYAALRKEYSELNNMTFKHCYDRAYEDGHSSGWDEIASYMRDYVEFTHDILRANKG